MSQRILVYVVTQEAVYRHRIAGVFATEQAARQCAEEVIKAERDDYHDYEVSRTYIDEPCADVTTIAIYSRTKGIVRVENIS